MCTQVAIIVGLDLHRNRITDGSFDLTLFVYLLARKFPRVLHPLRLKFSDVRNEPRLG